MGSPWGYLFFYKFNILPANELGDLANNQLSFYFSNQSLATFRIEMHFYFLTV